MASSAKKVLLTTRIIGGATGAIAISTPIRTFGGGALKVGPPLGRVHGRFTAGTWQLVIPGRIDNNNLKSTNQKVHK